MTGPAFDISQYFDDPTFRSEYSKTSQGRRDLLLHDTAAFKKELLDAMDYAKKNKAPTDKLQKQLDHADYILTHGQRGSEDFASLPGVSDRAKKLLTGPSLTIGTGAIAGALKLPEFLADMGLAVPDKILKVHGLQESGLGRTIRGAREKLTDIQGSVDETFPHAGPLGTVSELGGSIAAGGPALGKIGEVGATGIAKVAGKVGLPGLGDFITSGVASANPAVRAASRVLGGLPFQGAIQASLPEGATAKDRAVNAAVQTGGEVLGGLIGPSRPIGAPEVRGPGTAPPLETTPTPTPADIISKSSAKGAVIQASKDLKKEYTFAAAAGARDSWIAANAGKTEKDWLALSPDTRSAFRKDWAAANPFEKWKEGNTPAVAPAEAPTAVESAPVNPLQAKAEELYTTSAGVGAPPFAKLIPERQKLWMDAAQEEAPPTTVATPSVVPPAVEPITPPTPPLSTATLQPRTTALEEVPPTAPGLNYKTVLGMSPEEIESAAGAARTSDKNLLTNLFGVDGAKKYSRLQSVANSLVRSHEETNAASNEIAAMESRLSQAQQNQLFGIDQVGYNADELRSISKVANDYAPGALKDVDNHELYRVVGRELTQDRPHENVESAIRLRATMGELANRGIPSEQALVEGLRERVRQGYTTDAQAMELAKATWADMQRAGVFTQEPLPQQAQLSAPVSEPTPVVKSPDLAPTPPPPTPKLPLVPEDLSQVSFRDLGATSKKLYTVLDKLPRDSPARPMVEQQLARLEAEVRGRPEFGKSTGSTTTPNDATAPKTIKVRGSARTIAPTPEAPEPPIEVTYARARKPETLPDAELPVFLSHYANLVDQATDPRMQAEFGKVRDRIAAEIAKRQNPLGSTDLRVLGRIAGTSSGLLYGYSQPAKDSHDRAINAFMWGAVGFGAAYGIEKAFDFYKIGPQEPPSQLTTPPSKAVVRLKDLQEPPGGLMRWMRDFYWGTTRQTYPTERLLNVVKPYDAALAKAASDALVNYGLYISQTETALQDRLVWVNPKTGLSTYIDKNVLFGPGNSGPVMSPRAIIQDLGQGDIDGIGQVWGALAMNELYDIHGPKTPLPMSQMEARQIFTNAPPHMIQAAKEFRAYAAGLLWIQKAAGLIDDAAYQRMVTQEWYAPMYHQFENGPIRNLRNWRTQQLRAEKPTQAFQGGSKVKIVNPVDQIIKLTPVYLRAAEFNQMRQRLVDMANQIGDKDVRRAFMYRVKPTGAAATNLTAMTKAARASAKQLGLPLDALNGMVASMAPDGTRGLMAHWQNGQMVTYNVNQDIYRVMKSLLPMEQDMLVGLMSKPGQYVSHAVTGSPEWLFAQFFKDSFEQAMMSKHGVIPLWDSAVAIKNIYQRSPRYLQLLDAGGPGSVQSLKFLDPKRAINLAQAGGDNALEIAVNQLKTLHPWEAWKTLAQPLGDAGRVAEALKVMDHGGSVLDAVYAAHNVLGNTRMVGAYGAIKTLTRAVPFLRAGVASLDEMSTRAGVNFFREPEGMSRTTAALSFAGKGLLYVGAPTLAFWAAQKDDEELRKLRNTRVGQSYWLLRPSNFGLSGDQIIKIPKPHQMGVLFGSGMEAALDMAYSKDHVSGDAWAQSFLNQTFVNALPVFGAVPMGMLANYDFGRGGAILGQQDQQVDPTQAGAYTATLPARVVGQFTGAAPMIGKYLSAPMLDFVSRSVVPMVGEDLMMSIGQVGDYLSRGYVPAATEAPVIRNFVVKTGQINNSDVEKFYDYAAKAEGVYTAFHIKQEHDPADAFAYWAKHPTEMALVTMLDQTRREIGELRKASEDMRYMMTESPAKRGAMQKYFAQLIQQKAEIAVKLFEGGH